MNPATWLDLTEAKIERALRGPGLGLQIPPFRFLIRSNTGLLSRPLHLLYQDYVLETEPSGFYDFRVNVLKGRENLVGKQIVEFDWEGSSPFPPLPLPHAHPLFEWGLNWCIATASGAHTVIHSAVVERNGMALVLPGQPGSGKSTLCAALVLRGWRLLSDELTIVSQSSGCVQPVPRPISLKNQSIDVIQQNFPAAVMTDPVSDTHKGRIAYVRAPAESTCAALLAVPIGYVLLPKFQAGAQLVSEPLSRATALTELMEHTFNVGLMGASGFEALAHAISNAKCYAVEYGDLASIVQWVEATCQPST